MNDTPPALEFDRVSKTYDSTGGALTALRDVTVRVQPGRTIAIVGRSGSGKSTLLHLAAGIEVPSRGSVSVGGRDLSRLSDGERARVRRDEVGLVFQFFHLLPHLSVFENVVLPDLIAGEPASSFEPRAGELLSRVGLGDRARDPVHVLSGGEKQRVAICRALIRRPRLLLADEPTGNLDDDTGRVVMQLVLEMAREEGATVVFVTHEAELAELADETWRIMSGVLEPT